MEPVYANHSGRIRDQQNRRRFSLGGYYQNQDFFSTTINESSGGEDHIIQNREGQLSNNSRAFPIFDFAHGRPPELEFSSQSSREWDQDLLTHPNTFREVSLKKLFLLTNITS